VVLLLPWNIIFGMSSRSSKNNPQNGRRRRAAPKCQQCNKTFPPIPPPCCNDSLCIYSLVANQVMQSHGGNTGAIPKLFLCLCYTNIIAKLVTKHLHLAKLVKICDFCHKFVRLGGPLGPDDRDSLICDKNHKRIKDPRHNMEGQKNSHGSHTETMGAAGHCLYSCI